MSSSTLGEPGWPAGNLNGWFRYIVAVGKTDRLDARLQASELAGWRADSTRVVFRVTDEFGAIRPYANDAIALSLDGPAQIIGDNPFTLVGGTGAVWQD